MLALAKRSNKIKRSFGDRTFSIFNHLFLGFCAAVCIFPLFYVFMYSITPYEDYLADPLRLFPPEVTFTAYKELFTFPLMKTGYFSTIFVTVVGTALNIFLLCITAYPLSKRNLKGRNVIMALITFTMFFNGGIITHYILVSKLGIIDTRWSMLLPGAMSIYNMIIARTFLQNSIPNELLEAAQLDGCTDIQYLFKVVLPLSKAVLAVLVLFYGVAHWNTYFNAMIYLRNRDLFPLTLFLKEILISGQIDPSTVSDPELAEKVSQLAGVIKYSLIVVSMVPVMIIYPFVQKYFVKGVTIGAVKG